MVVHLSDTKRNKAVSTHDMAIGFPDDKRDTVIPSTILQCYWVSDFSVFLCYAHFIFPQTISETFGKVVSVCVSVIAWVKFNDNFTSYGCFQQHKHIEIIYNSTWK